MMALPQNNTAWPVHTRHTENLAEYAAWYSGDPDQLQGFYGPRTGAAQPRTSQLRGGVVGKVARWWWGQPTPTGEQRSKLHVPLAADICGTSADLLFSEPPALVGQDKNTGLTDYLDKLREDGLDAKLHEGAEVTAALGGGFLRTVWDRAVSPLPWTEIAHPDGAVPEFRAGRLRAVTLWTELGAIASGVVHRLLERHELGAIEYGLYAGTGTNLGRRVALQEHSDAAHLAELVNEDGLQVTGIDRLTVAYVPNMLPNRVHKNSDQGRSDLQGITPFLDSLDEAYSSWLRDIRVAKARLHVPAMYLDSDGPGQGASLDLDREVYVPLEGVLGTGKDGLLIDAQQFEIRVAEHKDTCEAWTKVAIESAGYSTQSLSSGAGGAVTAAEVHAHERRSYMTRGKKSRYWAKAIREHVAAQVDIANAHLGAGVKPGPISVEFPDGVQDSAASVAQTLQLLHNAEAVSVQTRVQMLNPDWDKERVDAEASAILAQSGGAPLPNPDDAGF